MTLSPTYTMPVRRRIWNELAFLKRSGVFSYAFSLTFWPRPFVFFGSPVRVVRRGAVNSGAAAGSESDVAAELESTADSDSNSGLG